MNETMASRLAEQGDDTTRDAVLIDAAGELAAEVEELVHRIGLLTLNARLDAVRSSDGEGELMQALEASVNSAEGSLAEVGDFKALLQSLRAHLLPSGSASDG